MRRTGSARPQIPRRATETSGSPQTSEATRTSEAPQSGRALREETQILAHETNAAPPAIPHWDGPPLSAWRAWTPRELAARIGSAPITWYVVGGFGIDTWIGHATRAHDDLEIAVPRASFSALAAQLAPLAPHVVGEGEVRRLGPGGVHPASRHQTWMLDPETHTWRVDVMLDRGDDTTWVFRRDPTIQLPLGEAVVRRDGIPVLCPQAILLYKAKLTRDKDEQDFEACLPRLDTPARSWLADCLRRTHPGHDWIRRLD